MSEEYLKRKTQQLEKRKKFPWLFVLAQAKARCTNPNLPNYKYYGARGIKCLLTESEIKSLWLRDTIGLKNPSIDRINSDGHYEFSNCRFIEKMRNSGRVNGNKTHCKNGHKFTRENTFQEKSSYRHCKTCHRDRERKRNRIKNNIPQTDWRKP